MQRRIEDAPISIRQYSNNASLSNVLENLK